MASGLEISDGERFSVGANFSVDSRTDTIRIGRVPSVDTIGFFGVTPIVQPAAIASPGAIGAAFVQAEVAALKTAIDAIRVALVNLGLTA